MFVSKLVRSSGYALIVAGVLVLFNVLHPNELADPEFLTRPLWTPVYVALSLAFVLGHYGYVGVVLKLSEKGGILGTLGLVFSFLGMSVVSGAMGLVDAFILPSLARSNVAEQALRENGPVWVNLPVYYLFFLFFVLGSILLAISMFRSGMFPRPAAILLAVTAPLWFVFFETPPFAAYLLSSCLVGVAWIWIGSSMARRTGPVAGMAEP